MLNLLSIDLEDYFQVQAYSGVVKYAEWERYESRVERNTDRLLEILNGSSFFNSSTATPQHGSTPRLAVGSTAARQHRNTGTFFILGWTAERYPALIRRIKGEGHEIACHGYAHKAIFRQTPQEFRQDIHKAKALLEDITGEEIIGYRAPTYSITKKSLWALRILAEEGFQYDSSIFPIRHDLYGMPDAPRFPFMIHFDGTDSPVFSPLPLRQHGNTAARQHAPSGLPQHGSTATRQHFLFEFPLSTVRFWNLNLPVSGGGYFRLLPYSFFKRGLNRIISKERQPFIFYVHPWELDPDQPRIGGVGLKSKFRHTINLKNTESKLKRLLSDFFFSPLRDYLSSTQSSP